MKMLFLYIFLSFIAAITIVQAQQRGYDSTITIIENELPSSLLNHERTGFETTQLNNKRSHIFVRQQKDKHNKEDHNINHVDMDMTTMNDNNRTNSANKNITTHPHFKYGKFMFASPTLLTANPALVILAGILTVFIWFSGFAIDHFIDRQEQSAYYSAISRLGQDGYCYENDDVDDEQYSLQELDFNLMDSNADIIL